MPQWLSALPMAVKQLALRGDVIKKGEKSGYQALPWVRYITQNGDYQLRTT